MPGAAAQSTSQAVFRITHKGLVTPHWHPRATELIFIVQGQARVGFLDGSNVLFSNDLTAGDASIFPRALLHWIENIGKGELILTSALDGEDPGAISASLSLAAVPVDIVKATFGITKKEAAIFTSAKKPVVFV